MKRLFTGLVGVATVVAAGGARAAEYYVAPTGSDSAAGTMAAPFATLQKGINTAAPGDTVWIRGGTYKITTPASSAAGVNFSKSGTSDTNRIKYWAYPGEVPVFDFSGLTISTSGYTNGFNVSGSWIHIKGLEVANVPMNMFSNNGISVNSAHDDIFESLNLHHNSGTGIFINAGTGGHLILNSDAHDNYDPNSNQGNGQNADGFGVHYQMTGNRTIIRGCRAWWNSDDGYDLINHEVSVTVESSWAMGNGYANYGTTNPPDGNGNGFKMGSSKTGVRHLVQGNVAWKNKASGFYANHSSGGNTWYNNTSFQNGTQYNMLASPPDMPDVTITLTGSLVHIMRNNLGMPNRNSNMTGVDTMFNTWDLMITPANADFLSVSDPSVSGTGMSIEASGAIGPRAPDGSMPKIDFLKLAMGSKMIDKGTDVGLPFVGSAPDLGAYEFGATTTTGTGGTSGAGGTMGAGGRGGAGGTSGAAGTTGSGGRGGTSGAAGSSGTGGASAVAGAGGSGLVGPGTGGTGVATTGTAGTGGTDASPAGTGGASATGTAGAGATGTAGAGPGENAAGGCACAIDAASPERTSLSATAVLGALSSLLLVKRRRRVPRK
jgi:hypothetical protein